MPAAEKRTAGPEIKARFSLLLPYKAFESFELSFPIYRCLANKLPIRGNTTLGHPMLYSRAQPLRIRDGVALTSGPQGLPVALTQEQSKATQRERERDREGERAHKTHNRGSKKCGSLLSSRLSELPKPYRSRLPQSRPRNPTPKALHRKPNKP